MYVTRQFETNATLRLPTGPQASLAHAAAAAAVFSALRSSMAGLPPPLCSAMLSRIRSRTPAFNKIREGGGEQEREYCWKICVCCTGV